MELRYEGRLRLRDPSNFGKLLDPEAVGKAFPGVTAVTKEGEWYRAKMSIGVGSLKGAMDVKFRYSEVQEDRATVVGTANGLQSVVDFTISFFREGSEVRWVFQGNARGLISALGKPIVDAAARSIVEKVTANLQELV
ncbi:carbon monoxide dehydrogenase or xanthine dehydrogenase, subunit G [Thermoproteus uzoniensis 768-20]|uniref:Carbon monoxide dehydrogenase or xanthine dehydrogenase, subunit G n=1 Tax=Thermoproteus uzoniensis (strain 768-20) TaxID=999630 RepID=F2L2X0_THEU7|nr:SRPBCC domain-containing protein [Thermoproteus uzoniensis]AEA11908.1 carbon monoxide dehydrogenase or xanthine dehydrogenase, subunit G [Thermoproteus uzoniensis 768-20]